MRTVPRDLSIPRLLIAGTHSGVGKTTVTVGLIQALRRRGIRVQPFKLGPDYIDPGYHTQVAGRSCRNLDTWLIPSNRLGELFQRGCAGADLALIEGVMGLYDGIGATSEEGSTAELAKRLQIPVLLVIDAGSLSRSAAAIVRGYREFDRKVKIVGCIVNRVGSASHFRLLKEGIEKLAGLPVIGWLPRDDRLTLPERHLGLVPSNEDRGWRKALGPLAARIEEGIDLQAVLRLARQAASLPVSESLSGEFLSRKQKPSDSDTQILRNSGTSKVPIGVARDEAFHFYYPENLELLKELGTEPVPFSPLTDSSLPKGLAALYIGGGFPEVYASQLARNRRLHRQIRQAVAAGMPIYAECGGLMFLTQAILSTRGRRHPMVGLLPGEVRMTDRLQNFGYKRVRAIRPSPLARAGEEARGHEFHHSIASGIPARLTAAYEATSLVQKETRMEGYTRQNLIASYIHLHFLSQPRWAERFVQAAREWVMDRKGE